MANLKERNIALVSKDSEGVTTIDYPLTSTEMVEGLEEFVKTHSTPLTLPLPLNNGGTGATNAAAARANLGLGDVAVENILPITKGGTGATDATGALSNLGILGAIVNASVSGKTITFTKKDNTKFSIDTQDTNNGIVVALLEQNGYIKFVNGLILQWGLSKKGYTQYHLPLNSVLCGYVSWCYNNDDYSTNAINISSFTSNSFISKSDSVSDGKNRVAWLVIGL